MRNSLRRPAAEPYEPHGNPLMAPTLSGFAIGAGAVAAALYATAAMLMVRDLRRHRLLPSTVLLPIVVVALILHALTTWQQIHRADGYYFGFFTASTLVTLVMTAFVTLSAVRLPVQNLLLLVLPITIVALLASFAGRTAFTPIAHLDAPLVAHILLSVTAYSILFMAACQALVLTYQEHVLRSKRSMVTLRLLPPLETMESLLFAQLWAGIAALTFAILSGFAFLDDMFAQQVVHHTVLALASWVIYAGLLTGHYVFGWRSYTATYGTLIAFALLLLAYFGSKFVLEILLAS
jgi:ABC-type uncharacterized transport system permease subunit